MAQNDFGKRLAVVIPFIIDEISSIEENFKLWNTHVPCSSNSIVSRHVDLIFYYNQDWAKQPQLIKRLKVAFNTSSARQCFRKLKFLMARLPPHTEQDQYPLGSSLMFFKALEMPTLLDHYTFMYWMETDQRPCRSAWLDQIYRLATHSAGAWMIGSINRDGQQSNTYSSFADHLNGNALYRMDDPKFHDFIARVQEEFSRNKGRFLSSFDIAIYLVARHTLSFEEYAAIKHKFQYTNVIQNRYRAAINATNICSTELGTFLIHGRNVMFKS